MGMFKKKTHDYDKFFYGLVLSKSKSLHNYVMTHPEGSTYARKQIIEAKENIAKLNPILRGFFILAMQSPTNFSYDSDAYMTRFRDFSTEYSITNNVYPYGEITYRENDNKIFIEKGKYVLTESSLDIRIFESVYSALQTLRRNAAEIDFNVLKREQIAKYERSYGGEYK